MFSITAPHFPSHHLSASSGHRVQTFSFCSSFLKLLALTLLPFLPGSCWVPFIQVENWFDAEVLNICQLVHSVIKLLRCDVLKFGEWSHESLPNVKELDHDPLKTSDSRQSFSSLMLQNPEFLFRSLCNAAAWKHTHTHTHTHVHVTKLWCLGQSHIRLNTKHKSLFIHIWVLNYHWDIKAITHTHKWCWGQTRVSNTRWNFIFFRVVMS